MLPLKAHHLMGILRQAGLAQPPIPSRANGDALLTVSPARRTLSGRLGGIACVLVSALALGTLCGCTSTATTKLRSVVPATLKGWVPIAYGNAQISVPSDWKVEYEQACWFMRTPGTVEVGPGGNGICAPYGGRAVPVVALGPRPALVKVTGGPRRSMNGLTLIRYLHSAAETSYFIPSLDVALTLIGEGAQQVLRTLTESPRSWVLASGPAPVVPSTWRSLSFAGVNFAVPATWPVLHYDTYGPPCGGGSPVFGTTGVFLDTDSKLAVSHCGELGYLSPKQATDGLSINRIPTQFFPASTRYGKCLRVHDLTACLATLYPYSVLVLRVSVPGRPKPVIVSIGLAGTGVVARTILYSLRPTG
jgi:hypothetical protein